MLTRTKTRRQLWVAAGLIAAGAVAAGERINLFLPEITCDVVCCLLLRLNRILLLHSLPSDSYHLYCLTISTVCLTLGRLQNNGSLSRSRGMQLGEGWVALEEADDENLSPEEIWERQMNITAQMFDQWGVVRDVRVLPNPDYMRKDESLPRFLQGTSVDEVAERAAHRAIEDMEEQRREEEAAWADPDEEMIQAVVPEPVEGGEDAETDEYAEEEALEKAKEKADNLKKLQWIGAARNAATRVAVAQTEIDRARLHDWETENPREFPWGIVYPAAEYPDGMPVRDNMENAGEDDEDEED